jgi:lysophospholipase L1-like esterase
MAPKTHSREQPSHRKRFYILVPLVACLATLGMAEIVLRLTEKRDTSYFYKVTGSMYDYAAGPENIRLKPSTTTRVETPEFDVFQITNIHGFRDHEYPKAKPDRFRRIAVIGDSITFGAGAQGEHSFAKVLERRLAARPPGDANIWTQVMNMGVGSYDTGQEYLLAKRAIAEFDADIVVLVHYANDFQPWPHRQDASGLPADYRVSPEEWRAKRPDAQQTAPAPQAPALLNSMADRSATARLLKKFWVGATLPASADKYQLGEPWNDPFWPFRNMDYASLPEWNLSTLYLEAIGEEARRHARGVIFATIPSGAQVNSFEWDRGRILHHFPSNETVTDEPQAAIRKTLKSKGHFLVDTLPVLQASSRQKNRMFHPYDGHLTVAGNEVIANLLDEALRDYIAGKTSFSPSPPEAPSIDDELLSQLRLLPDATLAKNNDKIRITTPPGQFAYAAAIPIPARTTSMTVIIDGDVISGGVQIGVLSRDRSTWVTQSSCLGDDKELKLSLPIKTDNVSDLIITNCALRNESPSTLEILGIRFESE